MMVVHRTRESINTFVGEARGLDSAVPALDANGGRSDRYGFEPTQYGANGESDTRNAAACRANDS